MRDRKTAEEQFNFGLNKLNYKEEKYLDFIGLAVDKNVQLRHRNTNIKNRGS